MDASFFLVRKISPFCSFRKDDATQINQKNGNDRPNFFMDDPECLYGSFSKMGCAPNFKSQMSRADPNSVFQPSSIFPPSFSPSFSYSTLFSTSRGYSLRLLLHNLLQP